MTAGGGLTTAENCAGTCIATIRRTAGALQHATIVSTIVR